MCVYVCVDIYIYMCVCVHDSRTFRQDLFATQRGIHKQPELHKRSLLEDTATKEAAKASPNASDAVVGWECLAFPHFPKAAVDAQKAAVAAEKAAAKALKVRNSMFAEVCQSQSIAP